MYTKTIPTEHQEQVALFDWANVQSQTIPALRLLHAIPNGGKRSPATAKLLKAEGVKPGVPDICLPVARGGYHGLYVELKRREGGRVSVKQQKWMIALAGEGYRCCVCHGWEDARNTIIGYLEEESHENTARPTEGRT